LFFQDISIERGDKRLRTCCYGDTRGDQDLLTLARAQQAVLESGLAQSGPQLRNPVVHFGLIRGAQQEFLVLVDDEEARGSSCNPVERSDPRRCLKGGRRDRLGQGGFLSPVSAGQQLSVLENRRGLSQIGREPTLPPTWRVDGILTQCFLQVAEHGISPRRSLTRK
jgi:hypothetical protein